MYSRRCNFYKLWCQAIVIKFDGNVNDSGNLIKKIELKSADSPDDNSGNFLIKVVCIFGCKHVFEIHVYTCNITICLVRA